MTSCVGIVGKVFGHKLNYISVRKLVKLIKKGYRFIPSPGTSSICKRCGLQFENKEEKRLSDWIKCSDRMPVQDKLVLIYLPETNERVSAYLKHAGQTGSLRTYWEDGQYPGIKLEAVTHWFDLPKPPETEG